ncbi:DUF1697 domain-containing protein [Mitsuaria sp. WAJ17]|uniref:DUF1697 domain-containing protein n=1 Tax=Mitsuaria sp. WAJ17 TaxID=2761452 RepID=UPI0015FED2F0|nr:DUF1697 domain-containing protein [Mitsuaria sp. WAJ17]MBB2486177.1 DUF1697 domain-containing protein [Mitsuaria sp. WAJ17]
MPRYIALLRGVSPQNARMPVLKACLEDAGYTEVRTLLSSGNVVFDGRFSPLPTLEKRLEQHIEAGMGRHFLVILRRQDALQAWLEADPFGPFELPADAKRIVTFLRQPPETPPALPQVAEGVHILACDGGQVLSAYQPHEDGPLFMRRLEQLFGRDITTRTLDTVKKCLKA